MIISFYLLDKSIVVSALTPLSDLQQTCTLWLKEHFDLYGDKAPNRDETHLCIITKVSVFEQYKREMIASNLKHCNEKLFNELWNAIFPTCIPRQYVDIPGKCETLAYIDQKRRVNNSSQVQEHLKQAFMLHRGGMFMSEREQ